MDPLQPGEPVRPRSTSAGFRDGRWVLTVAAIAALYVPAARLGLSLAFGPKSITAVWPPAGIALAAMLLFGDRVWPAITAGAFIANVLIPNQTIATASCIAAGNTLEAYIGASLLRRAGFQMSLTRRRDVLALVGLAAILSTIAGAGIGVTALSVFLPVLYPSSQVASNWLLWWVGDAMGVLLVTPVLLTWGAREAGEERPARALEGAALMALLVAVSVVFFASRTWVARPGHQQQHIVFPLVLWAALRFRPRTTATAVLCVSAIAIWGVTQGIGPFTAGTLNDRLILLQSFLGVLALTGLFAGAVTAEHRCAACECAALVAKEQAARSEAEERRAEIEAIMEVMPAAVWIARDPDCRTITGNRASYELVRAPTRSNVSQTPPEGEARPAHKLMRDGQELTADQLPMQHAAFHGVEVRNWELSVRLPDGTETEILGSASPLRDAAGKVRGCVGTFLDVSDLKRAEHALRVEARRKDEFLALLAHELRNPLAPMRTAAQLLRRPGRTEAVAARALDIIDRQITHMVRLVDELLDVSRIAHGKITLQSQRLDLSALARTAVEEHGPALAAAQLSLETRLPEAPLWVNGDPTRLAQVIGNLLNNAAKFTPHGGRVTVELAAAPASEGVVLAVRDTGIGMEPEVIQYVFEPFVQADQGIGRSRGGLGLGLSLAKGLIDLHGGRISAASGGQGKGSEIRIWLPLAAPAELAEARSAAPCRQARSLKVLIVEDNVDAAESLQMLLASCGHEVTVARDGPESLEACQRVRPEVVFCDIGLPGTMTGYDVAAGIRRDPGLSSALLVAMTGYGTDEDKRRAREAGFDLHLTKPANQAEMERILELAARRPR